ncbi:hypothetical protein QFC21_003144 [Naganishia friedmannii]|uniref:Uncharacterized protein n=1 Tax=Naganishia friedmannii TaxID=89922 RepID=A0ACC2VSC3_9TREE|nr:hypothetical protein QFC21_003144 [Naganishia friedmannii]
METTLAQHLHSALLSGACSDITLLIPQWARSYALHRVVLVQAGFFDGLFQGGFEEGLRGYDDDDVAGLAGRRGKGREVEIWFTLLPTQAEPLTPSFPYPPSTATSPPSLSSSSKQTPSQAQTQTTAPRLLLSILATSIYLGQNPLVRECLGMVLGSISPWSVCRYLEFAIGRGIGSEDEDGEGEEDDLDGPAVGMERVGKRYDPDLTDSASVFTTGTTVKYGTSLSIRTTTTTEKNSFHKIEMQDPRAEEEIKKESPALPLPSSSSSSSFASTEQPPGNRASRPRYFYGFAGDKIGEACVAWLCRWGVDILGMEEELAYSSSVLTPTKTGQDLESRLAKIALANSSTTTSSSPLSHNHQQTLRIWARGALPAEWVRAVIASDSFWVRNEMERYAFAKRVVALRATSGSAGRGSRDSEREDEDEAREEEEEQEQQALNAIFKTGTFEELSSLSIDINPSTGTPYVPMAVLQAALWSASDYQGRITAYRPDGTVTITSPSASSSATTSNAGAGRRGNTTVPTTLTDPKVLKNGLAMTTREIRELAMSAERDISVSPRRRALTSHGPTPRAHSGRASPAHGHSWTPRAPVVNEPSFGPFTTLLDRPFWPVPTDNTLRIGEAVTQSLGFYPAQALPDLGPLGASLDAPLAASGPGEAGKELHTGMGSGDRWFGFGSSMRTGREIAAPTSVGKENEDEALWSRYEPFRFSVEFWGIDLLGEKERAYSHTVFHAGSYFNIYVQTIRKKDKGIQLGIYLHRQSMLEPVPFPSTSRAASVAARLRATTGGDDTPSASAPWNASNGYNHPQTAHPLAIHRTMSVTPVGSMPRSMSPTAGALSDDEGLGRRNNGAAGGGGGGGDETPGAEVFTDRYWARSRRGDTDNQKGLNAPYRDPRKIAKVFFSISCASAMGTALTRFSSGPDMFTISQSWGWKSSSLRSQEYLSSSQPPSQAPNNPPTSTSVTFADALGPQPSSLESSQRPRAARARSGPILTHSTNSASYDGSAASGPSLGERLDEGVLGWISDPIEFTSDSALKNSDSGQHEQWKHKDLRSLRATVVMGVI